jgi:hypothetical protein
MTREDNVRKFIKQCIQSIYAGKSKAALLLSPENSGISGE